MHTPLTCKLTCIPVSGSAREPLESRWIESRWIESRWIESRWIESPYLGRARRQRRRPPHRAQPRVDDQRVEQLGELRELKVLVVATLKFKLKCELKCESEARVGSAFPVSLVRVVDNYARSGERTSGAAQVDGGLGCWTQVKLEARSGVGVRGGASVLEYGWKC